MAELAEHAWWIPEVEDPEHVKMSELKAATRHIPLPNGGSNSGYLIFCENPADLKVGDGFEIWPIGVGPIERIDMWPEGAEIKFPLSDAD